MATHTIQYVGGSQYKYVSEYKRGDTQIWIAQVHGNNIHRASKDFETEREAAIFVDKIMLRN